MSNEINFKLGRQEFKINENELSKAKVSFTRLGGRRIALKSANGKEVKFKPSFIENKINKNKGLEKIEKSILNRIIKNKGYEKTDEGPNLFEAELTQKSSIVKALWNR